MSLLVLNMSQGTFIRVDGIKTPEYNKKVKELITPFGKDTLSHWDKEDKMVIVPEHLNTYVEKNYGSKYCSYRLPVLVDGNCREVPGQIIRTAPFPPVVPPPP